MFEALTSPALLNILNEIEEVLKIAAILGAGLWGYYRFFKGRTFQPRLELSTSGTAFRNGEIHLVICNVGLKNVGLSRVDFFQQGSGLTISTCDLAQLRTKGTPVWVPKKTVPVFTSNAWIEPGEPLTDQIVRSLKPESSLLRLELRIVTKGQEWTCSSIVNCCLDDQTLNQLRISSRVAAWNSVGDVPILKPVQDSGADQKDAPKPVRTRQLE